MFSKRLLAKRDLKNAQMNDYLTEDNKYFFNMLKKQPETLKKKYNLRKKEEIKEAKSDIFARFESDEVQRSSTALYKLVESFKQEDSKKSKVPQITDCDENLKSINKTPQDGFIWSELLHTLRSKHAPKPEQNKLKRKYEAVKSTTITSDGEHSDDSIIEISSKKIDSKKDVCYLGTKQTYPQNQNIPQVDQQTLSLLKKLNADIIQENSKFMCSQMNFNSNNIFPGFPNFQNLSFPLQNNNIQNNPLLQNLRLALNNNSLYSNLNSLPQILNQQLYPSNNFSQFWNNYQNSNSILQAKLNNLNLMNTMKTTPNYNWSSLMTLLQQNESKKMKPSTQKNVPSNQIKSPQVSTTTSTGSSATKSLAQSIAKYNDPKQVPKEYKDQFIKKIQFCCITYDFNEESRQVKEKNERLAYLQEFTELVNDQNCLTAIILPNLEIVIEMIEKNIFRPLPILKKAPPPSEGMNAAEEDDILIDPSWAHFQPIYEFFLQLISKEAIDVKSLKGFITHSFIQEFLDLFDAEEPREREYLKNILHRLYAKLVPRRKMIRKAMNDSFHSLIHESVKFNGAPELLDILASIISGFAVPLREEHIIFFKTIIIPLHKVQSCYLYHENIVRASMLFLSKDPNLSINLVEGLLKYWPFANSAKEMMFLNEILEVLEVCEITKLEPLINKLFKRLIKCIAGSHLQVADRAMCFFENDYFLTILKTYRQITFPLLVPVIATIAENHWHKVLQESLNALKTILKEIDYQAFDKALQQKENSKCMYLVQDPKVLKKERSKVDDKWKILSKQAQSKNPSFKEPTVPYIDSHIVGNHNGLDNGNIVFY